MKKCNSHKINENFERNYNLRINFSSSFELGKIITFALILLTISKYATAKVENIIDPSMPANFMLPQEEKEVEKDKKTSVVLKLQGIIKTNSKSKVIINNETYYEGDSINNYTLDKIGKNEAILLTENGEQLILKINRAIYSQKQSTENKLEKPIDKQNSTNNKDNVELSNTDMASLFAKQLLAEYKPLDTALQNCEPTTLNIPIPFTEENTTNPYEQSILGWQKDGTCLVIHKIGNKKAECRYLKENIKSVLEDKNIEPQLAQLYQLEKENPGKTFDIEVELSNYCKLI